VERCCEAHLAMLQQKLNHSTISPVCVHSHMFDLCCCCCLQEKQQAEVVERCREAYLAMLQRNATGRVLSHRARSHLRQACLAAATHKVLMEEAPVSVTVCYVASSS
jgi:hypothetical protein